MRPPKQSIGQHLRFRPLVAALRLVAAASQRSRSEELGSQLAAASPPQLEHSLEERAYPFGLPLRQLVATLFEFSPGHPDGCLPAVVFPLRLPLRLPGRVGNRVSLARAHPLLRPGDVARRAANS